MVNMDMIMGNITQKQDEKMQFWLDIFQDTINLICIYFLFANNHNIIGWIISLYELMRLGAYFSLGSRLKSKVLQIYLRKLM